jgi:hypothetical protein
MLAGSLWQQSPTSHNKLLRKLTASSALYQQQSEVAATDGMINITLLTNNVAVHTVENAQR